MSDQNYVEIGYSVENIGPFASESGPAMSSAYIAAQPLLILGWRLHEEPTISEWVDDLNRLEPFARRAKAEQLSKGAPRGVGRKVIAELLLRAAEGGRSRLVTSGAFAAFEGSEPSPNDPKRAAKAGTEHDRITGLTTSADRIVRALVAYPEAIEPAENPLAAKRSEQRLLQEVGAKILIERPESPAKRRRSVA